MNTKIVSEMNELGQTSTKVTEYEIPASSFLLFVLSFFFSFLVLEFFFDFSELFSGLKHTKKHKLTKLVNKSTKLTVNKLIGLRVRCTDPGSEFGPAHRS